MAVILFRVGSPRRASFIILACVIVAASASAAPELSITAPPFGQPLTDLRPTIVVSYGSLDPAAPVNVSSLQLTVSENGRPVQGTTTPGESSATFVPVSDISAGTLAVSASIADANGGSASAERTYEVLPTYQLLTPATAGPDEALTVTARGLDPAGSNSLVFYSRRAPGTVEAILDSIDSDAGTATVRVPDTVATGKTFLKVNGRVSQTGIQFTPRFPYTICGPASRAVAMADGSLIVQHGRASPTLPGCPYVTSGWDTVVSRTYPDGRVILLDKFKTGGTVGVPYSSETGEIRALAADTTGEEYALLLQGVFDAGLYIKHRGRVVRLAETYGYQGLDFDAAGNFILTKKEGGAYGGTLRFLLATAEAFETQDVVTPEEIASLTLDDLAAFVPALEISCANQLYFGVYRWAETGDSISSSIYRLDLSTGQISKRVDMPDVFSRLALSCHTGEIVGVRYNSFDYTVTYWRWVDGSGQSVQTIDQFDQGYFYEHSLLVLSSGTILSLRGGFELVERIEPCTDCADGSCCAGSAQPFCPRAPEAGITILTSTTRWRPQRQPDYDAALGSSRPIEVNFTGPKNLKPAPDTRLEITDPAGATLVAPSFALQVVDPNADPAQYRFNWSGLKAADGTSTWKQPDGSPLPAGNYTMRVIAKTAEDEELRSESPVSLVEVNSIRLSDANGLDLPDNPGPGGGKRVFAEARTPGSVVMDRLRVTATIFPPVTDAPAGQGVTVYLRSLDVDDPSAWKAPVDDGVGPDNCLRATPPQPQVDCQIPDAGRLDGTDGDAILPVPVPVQSSSVTVEMQVSTRQGDNYRVAASTYAPWLGGLVPLEFCPAEDTCIPADVRDAANVTPLEKVSMSEILTVWRTLHLEIDVMPDAVEQVPPSSPQPGTAYLDVLGAVTEVTTNTLAAQGQPMVTPDHTGAEDQWYFADLWLNWRDGAGVGPLRAVGSTASSLTVSNPQVDAPPLDLTTLTEPGATFRLSDDRKDALTSIPVRLQLTRDLLASVYIELDDDPPGNTESVTTFYRNLEDQELRRLPRSINSSPSYWTVLLVKGFDGPELEDADPNDPQHPLDRTARNEPGRGGTTSDSLQRVNGRLTSLVRQPNAVFFTETLRDLAASVGSSQDGAGRVIAHEILCHALGNYGGHGEEESVCSSPSAPSAQSASDNLRAVLRALPYPTMRD